ncbi:hypothetical protein HB818_16380 [Listeria booriae]|uniref:PcfJ domain-containing protein n=1 Tax=Listeria booriae TaxID=1552123 RepID=UPI00162A9538|nr:PcfJ domain-containing protein [Listeria booriae]MBC1287336.1 hypothetical protein [Listeria booriae]
MISDLTRIKENGATLLSCMSLEDVYRCFLESEYAKNKISDQLQKDLFNEFFWGDTEYPTNVRFICEGDRILKPNNTRLMKQIKASKSLLESKVLPIHAVKINSNLINQMFVKISFRQGNTHKDESSYQIIEVITENIQEVFLNCISNQCGIKTRRIQKQIFIGHTLADMKIFVEFQNKKMIPLPFEFPIACGFYFFDSLLDLHPFFKEVKTERTNLPFTWNDIWQSHNKRDLFQKKYKGRYFGKNANKYPLRYTYALYKIKSYLSLDAYAKFQAFCFAKSKNNVLPKELFVYSKNDITFIAELVQTYWLEKIEGAKYQQNFLNQVTDLLVMSRDLKEPVELRINSMKGFQKYHDDLARKQRKKALKKMKNETYKFSAHYRELIEVLNKIPNYTLIKTKAELYVEGEIMQHCVFSYHESIKSSRCVIYHYKNGVDEYTLEISFRNKRLWLDQCLGKHNMEPKQNLLLSIHNNLSMVSNFEKIMV